jgi:hypothetical protein
LHIAASEGRLNVVRFLVDECTGVRDSINALDRWNHTALDDAITGNYLQVRDFLLAAGGKLGSNIQLSSPSNNTSTTASA